jgi:hypothetical protein
MNACRLHRYLGIMLAAVAVTAGAQEITLFENENFNGRRFTANGSLQNLDNSGFNDRANSATIRSGSWQLCDDAFYRGQCVTLNPGNYPSLGAMGLAGRVSSIREVGWNSGGGGGDGGGNVGPGSGAIVLYDAPGFSGRAVSLNQPVANLDDIRFNDRAASAIVNSGTWQLCADADFESTCEVVGPGRHGDLGGVTGRVSSARPIAGDGRRGGGGGGGGMAGGGGNWGGRSRVVLYESQNFGGRPFTLAQDVLPNLDGTGFNDRAESIRVENGYWMFCSESNFRGDCRTFGPGDYPSLPPGLSNRISSGRRISNDYPYNAQPNWR